MKGLMKSRVVLAVALAGMVTAGCDVHGLSDPGTLSAIVVSPNPQTMPINGTQQFVATGTDYSGTRVMFTPVWTIASGGGTINSSGMFTAGAIAGTFANTVVATADGLSSTATIVVTHGPLATIVVTPTPATLAIGGTQQYVATGRDAAGNVVGFAPTWSVVANGGAISSTGIFTAGTVAGTFANTVQASDGDIKGNATVVVTPGAPASIAVTPNPVTLNVGTAQQFTAIARDANGNVVGVTPVWSVANGGGTIDASSGIFTAGATAGTYTNSVQATSGSISGAATVTVRAMPPTVQTIVVSPNPVVMLANGTQQFSATGKDGIGSAIAINPVWSVVAGGGTINTSTGVFTAGSATGTFTNTIRATSGGIAGFAAVTVTTTPPVLTTIVVSPNPAGMRTNATQQFIAVGRDASGGVFAINPVWSVVNGGGTISADGLFTAGAVAGTFSGTVRAASGALSGTATVVETSAAPASILGSAAADGIIAGTAVTCVSLGVVNADVAVSPGGAVSGFPPCVITGTKNLSNAVAQQNQLDLTTAYNILAAMPCLPSNLISANLGGTTKAAGVYCSATSIGVTGAVTLDGGGDPNAVFVFQAGTSLITAGNVVLINGAQAKNVYWLVGSSATLGTASQWQGNIIALTSITLVDNATLYGRALARNGAVTLGTGNVITLP